MDYTSTIASIEKFPDQVKQAWDETIAINIEKKSDINNVVVCGMGGSALGARIIKSYTSNVPIEIVTNYNVPDFVDEHTLIIISSYSGNTEETVSCFNQALEKKSMLFAIATGGEIAKIAKDNSIPAYIFDPVHNPSGQPRLASGYSIGSMLALFSKLNLMGIDRQNLDSALEFEDPREKAANLAEELKENAVVFVASDHLFGATHAMKNMVNETAKSFSALFDIPELNHHLMEGLTHPASLKDNLKFFFIESDLYHDRVKARYPITKEVVAKNNFKMIEFQATGETKLKQIFEVITLGGFLQIYLGQIYDVDPLSIPWVDYFKKELTK